MNAYVHDSISAGIGSLYRYTAPCGYMTDFVVRCATFYCPRCKRQHKTVHAEELLRQRR